MTTVLNHNVEEADGDNADSGSCEIATLSIDPYCMKTRMLEVPAAAAPVTLLTNTNGNLTKTFSIDKEGNVQKQAAAKLVHGTFEVRHVVDLGELDTLLNSLKPTQAVTYGRPAALNGEIVAQNVANPAPGAITRTRDNFQFQTSAGVLMLDYDPPKDGPALSPSELMQMIRQSCPALATVGMLWRASASSGVAGVGIRGQRIYILVNDASEIPRIGTVIFTRLWLASFGYYMISKSGQLLERAPIDASVWKPEGLDFAAAPVLAHGIQRTMYKSLVIDSGALDVGSIQALTVAESFAMKQIKAAARESIQPQVKAVKDKYIEENAPVLAARLQKLGIDSDATAIGIMLERAIMQNVLMGDWALTTADGKSVTVGTVLDNPDKYHGTRFADPLEPDADTRVAWLNLRNGGRPYLYSHLHHGTYYKLDRAPALIHVNSSELPRMVDSMAEILKKCGHMYERGGAMVYVNEEGKIIQAKPQWLSVEVQRLCRFEQLNKKEELIAVGCPSAVVNGILADAARLRMPKLTAVRNAPTMDSNGRQIVLPGYDEKTGLLVVSDTFGAWPSVPSAPSFTELKKAIDVLWQPFKQFPYAEASDKSVALAAVLTAAVRCCLRTSPGFGFSATAPGTGKTLLAQCVGALYDGVAPAVSPPISHEEEWAKSLFSAALGGAGTLLYDNAEHPIESASLCAVTTAPSIKSRVLGESRDAEAEHRMLILATGNGLQFVGDLNRRIFTCRLDANMEANKVAAREFDMEPLGYCINNRIKLINAALILIQGYVHAGLPRVCDGMASMDDWNKLVRSTIVWLVQQGVASGFVDPKLALARDSANDPDANMLASLLEGAKTIFGLNRRFTLAELIKRASSPVADLNDVLMDIAGERDVVNAKKMGHWLLKREGRIINGLRINRGDRDRENKATWEVRSA
jgi:hypothetical protein